MVFDEIGSTEYAFGFSLAMVKKIIDDMVSRCGEKDRGDCTELATRVFLLESIRLSTVSSASSAQHDAVEKNCDHSVCSWRINRRMGNASYYRVQKRRWCKVLKPDRLGMRRRET